MSSSDALWLKIWGAFAAIGFIMVIIGVIIEGVEHFKKFPRKEHARKLQIEKIGWFIVVIGLAMEFLGDSAAKRISDREAARLNKEAGDARKDAGEAFKLGSIANERAATNELQVAELNKESSIARLTAANAEKAAGMAIERAAKLEEARVILEKDVAESRKQVLEITLFTALVGTTNAQLVATNLLIEKQVEEVQKQNMLVAARQITQSQLEKFTNILKGVPRCPVRVFVQDGTETYETENFSHQVRELLDAAGFGVGKSEGIEKVKLGRNFGIGRSDTSDLQLLFYGNRKDGIVLPNFKIQFTESNIVTTFTFTASGTISLQAVPGMMNLAFAQLGITVALQVDEYKNCLKPGEWAIFIPQKY
jgi:hypothetical protein